MTFQLNIPLFTAVLICLQALPPASFSAEQANVASYYAKPIPQEKNTAGSALTYHDLKIDTSSAISQEPLVKLKEYGIEGEAFYARTDHLNAPYHRCICPDDPTQKLRKTVAEKLQKINARLAPLGLELYVFDAYRSVSCQRQLWDYFVNEAKRILGNDASPEKLTDYAGIYCSNPTKYDPANFRTWPTHLTGGAVDLTMRRKASGELVYMGGIFDDAADVTISRHYEDYTVSSKSGSNGDSASVIEARQNRRLLYWAMNDEGFANYHNEWWHFDYGDQMWAQNRQDKQSEDAFYGAI